VLTVNLATCVPNFI